jgi:hypothetical protein
MLQSHTCHVANKIQTIFLQTDTPCCKPQRT